MAFKLGSEKRGALVRKKLGKGILGEANNDGSIYISDKIKPGSKQERSVYNHEKQHQNDMDAGILGYGDNWVRYKNKTYHRKDGKTQYTKEEIKAAPTRMYGKKASMAKNYKKGYYGA